MTSNYTFITQVYIVVSLLSLIIWHFIADYLSNGKINVVIQCARWCKKYLILILVIGAILGHWFAQMNYYSKGL